MILSENINDKLIFDSHLHDCYVKKLFCKTKNGITIWEKNIIHECPYSLVQVSKFKIINGFMINQKEGKLFQLLENITICNDIQAVKAAEGLILTKNQNAFKLPKEKDDLKTIDSIILSEMDFQANNLMEIITHVYLNINMKVCELYKSFINLYTKLDDEFFLFNDFNGNSAILYSDEGQIFIPQCIKISEINIIEESSKCYKDIPIQIILNNKTLNVFLTQDRIIRTNSKLNTCKNNFQSIYLQNSNRLIIKRGNKVSIEIENRYTQLKFNLQSFNLTKLNFKHDNLSFSNINFIKKIANITSNQEFAGVFHTSDTHESETTVKFASILDNLLNIAVNKIAKIAKIFSLIGLSIIMFIIVIKTTKFFLV